MLNIRGAHDGAKRDLIDVRADRFEAHLGALQETSTNANQRVESKNYDWHFTSNLSRIRGQR